MTEPENEVVERVARAILKAEVPDADFDYCKSVIDHPLYEKAMGSARAAIGAMREPTEAMMIAAGANSFQQARAVWIRMLDEALK